jgi:hypothetical protein
VAKALKILAHPAVRRIFEEGWPMSAHRGLGCNRALAVLAERPEACGRGTMLARGFSLALLNQLVRAGWQASRHLERKERGED